MGALNRVTELKQQGKTESQIIDGLRQEGFSPKEIEEALSQSKIKSELGETAQNPKMASEIKSPQQMQPSMMQTKESLPEPSASQPMTQEISSPSPSTTQPPAQEYPEYSPETSYQEYPEYTPEANIETMNEIAEQVVNEKISNIKKQITSFIKSKEDILSEINQINGRLTKVENLLNELQIAVIRKIGEYGQNIQDIAKEMHATQDSFSKILDPLTDNIRELQKITGKKTLKPKTKKEKINFEDYLR